MSTCSKVVAIDGPCGSGKSEIARQVSEKLKIVYVDTGAMYRALGYWCDKFNVSFEDGPALSTFLKSINLCYGVSPQVLIEINGEDLTTLIREHHVSELASKVSKLSSIRTFLLDFQRDLGRDTTCVMEGRDIGTVIFPDAFCKIYLTASEEVRAERRLKQLQESGETSLTLEKVLEDVKERDHRDMNREVAPLKQANDSILIDSSEMTREEVLNKICEVCQEQAQKRSISLNA